MENHGGLDATGTLASFILTRFKRTEIIAK